MRHSILLLLVCAGTLPAQSFSFGAKGGAQLTSDLDSSFAQSESKRYAIGPMATVGLPFGLRLEFDALYRRTGYRTSNIDIVGDYFAERDRGNSWEFPIVVRRTLWHGIYGGAGYVPRVINGGGHVNAISITSINPLIQVYQTYNVPGLWDATHGVVGAAGIEKRVGPLRVAPEVRYTYWTRPAVQVYGSQGFSIVSTQNQVDLLVGITFP